MVEVWSCRTIPSAGSPRPGAPVVVRLLVLPLRLVPSPVGLEGAVGVVVRPGLVLVPLRLLVSVVLAEVQLVQVERVRVVQVVLVPASLAVPTLSFLHCVSSCRPELVVVAVVVVQLVLAEQLRVRVGQRVLVVVVQRVQVEQQRV
eukprot:s7845_g3.t1